MQYRMVLDSVPHHYEAYAKLGLLLGKQGDLNSAITYNLKAIQIYPSFSEAYFNLGARLVQAGVKLEAACACRHSSARPAKEADTSRCVWASLGNIKLSKT